MANSPAVIPVTSPPTLPEFIERVERRVQAWMQEGLSPSQALNSAWATSILELERDGTLPLGYLRVRTFENK